MFVFLTYFKGTFSEFYTFPFNNKSISVGGMYRQHSPKLSLNVIHPIQELFTIISPKMPVILFLTNLAHH